MLGYYQICSHIFLTLVTSGWKSMYRSGYVWCMNLEMHQTDWEWKLHRHDVATMKNKTQRSKNPFMSKLEEAEVMSNTHLDE